MKLFIVMFFLLILAVSIFFEIILLMSYSSSDKFNQWKSEFINGNNFHLGKLWGFFEKTIRIRYIFIYLGLIGLALSLINYRD